MPPGMSESGIANTRLSVNQNTVVPTPLQLLQNPVEGGGAIKEYYMEQFYSVPNRSSVSEISQVQIARDLLTSTNLSSTATQPAVDCTLISDACRSGESLRRPYGSRVTFTQTQVAEMKLVFERQRYVNQEECMQLAERIGLTPRQV